MDKTQYTLLRKGNAAFRQLPRSLKRIRSVDRDYETNPPILANSFPKSGTHLLLQILEGLPGAIHYGSFIASTPTLSFKERSQSAHLKLIDRLVPGEVCPAHLFYDHAYAQVLQRKNVAHFFIFRDLRDVVISEAHYLAHMNRWHRMHPYFKRLDSDQARITAAINGFSKTECPYDYPDVAARFRRYQGWLKRPDVLPVPYEGLRTETKHYLRRMAGFYAATSGRDYDQEEITEKMLANINPNASHTFRSGRIGAWKDVFTEDHKEYMKAVAGEQLIELGYEQGLKW